MSIRAKYLPENRFKNFNDRWESAKLADLCEINSKLSGKLPEKFYYIDLESVKEGVLSDEIELLNRADAPSRAQRLLEKGDVLYQTVRPYQRNNYFFDLDDPTNFVASTGYAILKPKKIDAKFLYQIMNTDRFTNEVMARTTGTSFPAISPKDLAKITIKIPSQKEQRRIGSFLLLIDQLINSKAKEINKMMNLQKAYMQQIFNQELRFKNNNNQKYQDWKTERLGDLGEFYNGLTGKTKNDFENGNKKYIQYLNIFQETLLDDKFNNYGYVSLKNNEKQNSVTHGDLLFTQSSETEDEIGMTSVYLGHEEIYLNSFSFGFKFSKPEEYDFRYIAFLFKSDLIRKQIIKEGQGSTRINLSSSRLENLKILLPETSEQQKIGKFLSILDRKINLKNQELEKIKKYKKAFLEKMFV